ncbi:site-specific integrase [Listeria seeligeri]|uniref:site-specific integrase n=1 Tax=Listeria seeligeri TaxID=1640 RepID=UPI0001C4EC8E|nr:site-specific integrase [Listeria seeligeri]CBH27782.1 phage integrase, putative [Listeria seeligeri serovar 1/2b str. SLCC3954]
MAGYRKRGKKWEYRIIYKDLNNERREKTKGGFLTKTEAREAAKIVEYKLMRGHDFAKEKMTVKQYLEYWYSLEKEGKGAYNTQRIIKQIIVMCVSYIGNIKLEQLNYAKYQEFINRAGKDYSHDTLVRYNSTIKEAFERGVDWGIIFRNPARKVSIKGTDRKLAEQKYINDKEIIILINLAKTWVEDDYMQLFVFIRLLYYTGARIGEITAIDISNHDYKQSTLALAHTMVQDGGKEWIVSNEMKTANSYRTISLDFETNELLHLWIKQQSSWFARYNIKNEDGAIFMTKKGHRMTPKFFRDKLTALCDGSDGELRRLTPHMFRHTHVVSLVEASLLKNESDAPSLKYIADRLGDSIQTVSKVYDHVSKKVSRLNQNKINNVVKNSEIGSRWAVGGQEIKKDLEND